MSPVGSNIRAGSTVFSTKEVSTTSVPDEPAPLARVGRELLREKFARADMGVTGANFAVAETGTVVLVSNEGNARLTTTCPRVHVALMGIEKVIPRLEDLPVFLKLLARAATGQTLSVYTTLMTGPRRPDDTDGPESFHLVLHTVPNTYQKSNILQYWKTVDEDYHWHIEILPIMGTKAKPYFLKEVYYTHISSEAAAEKYRKLGVR